MVSSKIHKTTATNLNAEGISSRPGSVSSPSLSTSTPRHATRKTTSSSRGKMKKKKKIGEKSLKDTFKGKGTQKDHAISGSEMSLKQRSLTATLEVGKLSS